MESNETYTAKVMQDDETGDQYIIFSGESLEGLGWEEGTVIEWIDNGDGTWTLRKGDKNEVV